MVGAGESGSIASWPWRWLFEPGLPAFRLPNRVRGDGEQYSVPVKPAGPGGGVVEKKVSGSGAG